VSVFQFFSSRSLPLSTPNSHQDCFPMTEKKITAPRWRNPPSLLTPTPTRHSVFVDEHFDLGDPLKGGNMNLDSIHKGNLGAEFFSIWVEPSLYKGNLRGARWS